MIMEFSLLIMFSFAVTYLSGYFLIPRLKRFGIVGKDVNKPGRPEVAEMGGIAIVAGLTAGVLLAVFLNTFDNFDFNVVFILASLLTVLGVAFIGVMDDLLDLPQWLKAILPLFAAVPLIAVRAAGSTSLHVPFVGPVDFGLFYILVLIPIGVAVASNLTNMFAGFNGLESGMGSAIFLIMSLFAIMYWRYEMLVLFLPMLGALLAFLIFNFYPAKAFPGDIGNLTIGAVLASGVIIGNMETVGALILLIYVGDFFIKLYNRFPSSKWWGEWKYGKLYPVEGKVRGLAQLVMKLFNGITEKKLTLAFIGMQLVLGIALIAVYGIH
ncbi:UDP-N-acetylglucosamine--dolichyl-phosphate N-acetylglucosaminephosphotransferase [Candidatus Micrarchaeota archaeon]|nr:UDP-N-acetylglucosamine--dolichyl-phosphate N-acetylglucosaminephosphotransferase [Candidatus Micrarchaeota archaeon]